MTTATGEAIRQLRESAGLSRKELANAAGISLVFLIKVEHGDRGLSPKTLAKIAQALGLTVKELATKIAVLEASAAPTEEAMRRGLMRAAAIGGSTAALIRPLIGAALPLSPAGVLAAAATAAVVAARRMQKATDHGSPEADLPLDIDAVRRELIARVEAMPAEQLAVLIALVEEAEAEEGAAS
ncbi:helix-turn-helix transcriptional regulator [Streptomyces lunaelactis]|uniref:helix-turn-helix domain-containing protein n=1 Tax=Streptomyces lunaelactis TaxID=1535768 RepID=UPI00131EDACB|nr:helix-turn-helix transcriptional regulator [Streptomyces lunaelactis]NUK09489.1 helix-turn-helix transcriptional regulator [Streptomyces lunaelactis]NUK73366.1 helix-turn-helix transcriptional regulator [Streptomyces lunaelactis]NUK87917.1 helix-turn-helix transcriptional regulator [Streptomyces lunaelactis]NUL10927.1 helix-turn-helix transcriptional regulator [Streptomyces lunaelactis]NUL24519.1 helix-turn-helix transcriptional regulator [Streptomyces lunaelactis]